MSRPAKSRPFYIPGQDRILNNLEGRDNQQLRQASAGRNQARTGQLGREARLRNIRRPHINRSLDVFSMFGLK